MKATSGFARTLVLLAAMVFVAGLLQVACAQGMRMTPEERAKQLKEQLSLNDEQTTAVTKIYTDAQKLMQEKMGDFQGDRDAMRKFFQANNAKSDSLIKALLTKDQVKKYEEIQKERMQRMQQRQRNNQ